MPAGAEISKDEVLAHLSRVIASRGFAKAESLQRFLQYTVDQYLAGSESQLKETVVAIEVFERPTSFDPRLDPIVRVQAKKVRDRLENYYQAEGRGEALRLSYPKGGYIPVFSREIGAVPLGVGVPVHRHWVGLCFLIVVILLQSGSTRTNASSATQRKASRSLAVLPFANLSEQKEDDYIGDALADELIRVLSSVDGLSVVARTSAFRFKGTARDPREAGRELGVSAVLEGSVQREEALLRIRARLIDVASGNNMWSASYDQTFASMLDAQADLSRAIAMSVQGQIRRGPVHVSRRPTESEKAYQAYLRGRYFLITLTADRLPKAVAAFDEAIRADAAFAAAHAGLADAYSLSDSYAPGLFPDAIRKARGSAERAISINPDSADAHASLGYIAFTEADFPSAESHLREAVRLNPNLCYAHQWLGSAVFLYQGRLQDALSELKMAMVSDPASVTVHQDIARIYWFMGDYDTAIRYFRAAIELEPQFARAHRDLGAVLALKGQWKEALDAVRKGLAFYPVNPAFASDLGWVLAASGRRREAMAVIRELEERSRKEKLSRGFTVKPWLGLGDVENAGRALARTSAKDFGAVSFLFLDPRYAVLRSDPRAIEAAVRFRIPCVNCKQAGR